VMRALNRSGRDWFELERADMKQVFDNFQIAEMRADTEKKTPKAHFSAVMRALNRSGRVQLVKTGPATFKEDAADADPVESLEPAGPEGGEPKRKRIPIPMLRRWADKWGEYCREHPELPGAERETMKAGFDELQKDDDGEQGKAHFSAVMCFLRQSGRHDLGTWKGYEKRGKHGGNAGADENEVEQYVSISAGHLSEMEAETAATFRGDVNFLGEKFGLGSVEVQWEEDRLMLIGSAVAVYKARLELVEMLRFYFPEEEVDVPEPPEGMPSEGEADGEASQPQELHWSESIECTLSAAQRKRTLDKTQELRERQRVAVKHWADRWEEWVKVHPKLIGAEREVMKAGFDEMQAAESGTAAKAHFSLVMNFLRQSGRRGIGAWKDYTPKSWPT